MKDSDIKEFGGELMKFLSQANIQTRVWHLQTTSYAQHVALNGFYDGIGDLQDTLIETYQGYYKSRIGGNMNFNIDSEWDESKPKEYLQMLNNYLHDAYTDKLMQPGCLKNIMDEITALVDKTLYLLTLS